MMVITLIGLALAVLILDNREPRKTALPGIGNVTFELL